MATTAHAEDLYLGRVIAVNREAGLLSVALMNSDETGKAFSAPERQYQVTIPEAQLPEQVLPGSVVRIWGNPSGKPMTLEASRVLLTRQGARGKDPTGVRRRIGKSRGQYGGRGRVHGHGRR